MYEDRLLRSQQMPEVTEIGKKDRSRSVLWQADLAHAREQLDGQGRLLEDWRNAVAAKDLEIQNLQVTNTWLLQRESATASTCLALGTWLTDAPQPSQALLQHISAAQFVVQAALGELAYKSEAAERLRLDLRVQAAKLREAEERCHSTEQVLEASKASQQALDQRLTATARQAERQRDLEQRLSVRILISTCLQAALQKSKNTHEGATKLQVDT